MLRSILFLGLTAIALAGCDNTGDSAGGGAAQESSAVGAQSDAAPPPPPSLPGKVVRFHAGTQLPPYIFQDPAGNTLDLGKLDQPVLVNMWATWCGPCVVEMPMLDTLAGEFSGKMRVLTISQDVRGAEVVEPFFAQRNFEHLEQWLDPETKLGQQFGDGGLLPVTILFDARGREIFRVEGDYDWDSEEAIAQISEAIEEQPAA